MSLDTVVGLDVAINKRLDQQKIDDLIALEVPIAITVTPLYFSDVTSTIFLETLSATDLEMFKSVIDYMSFIQEENCVIIKVDYTPGTKTFSAAKSYVRTEKSTETVDELTTGVLIGIRFEIPGFSVNPFVDIEVGYDDDFTTAQISDLADLGIVLTGNGKEFSVANDNECSVSFYKPASVAEDYIIDVDNPVMYLNKE